VASFPHELLVGLFRDRPAIATELLRSCAGIDVGKGEIETGSVELSQVTPPEYRADAVTIIRRPDRTVSAAVVVEVQRTIDKDKRSYTST
jgi:hypothetical protein